MASHLRCGILAGAVLAASALGGSACIDAVRPRLNPADVGGNAGFEVVAVRDTVRAVGEWALFYLRGDGAAHDYPVTWESASPAIVVSSGHGRFQLLTLVGAPAQVTVRVHYLSFVDSAAVVIDP